MAAEPLLTLCLTPRAEGAFEDIGNESPVAYVSGDYTQEVVSTDDAPAVIGAGPNLCGGVLKIDSESDTLNTGIYHIFPTSPLIKNQNYSVSIDATACGDETSIWQFGYGQSLLANGTGGRCLAPPTGKRDTISTWQTYTGYFTGGSSLDGDDYLFIELVAGSPFTVYFDNVVLLPAPNAAAPSSVSTTETSTVTSLSSTASSELATSTSESTSTSTAVSSTSTVSSESSPTSTVSPSSFTITFPDLLPTSTVSSESSTSTVPSNSSSTSTGSSQSFTITLPDLLPTTTMSSESSTITSSSLSSTSSVSYTMITSYMLTSSLTVINDPSSTASISSASSAGINSASTSTATTTTTSSYTSSTSLLPIPT